MRGTGKTFRRVLRALDLASSGERVIYVTSSNLAADYAYRLARTIAATHLSKAERNRIIFSNGTVRFMAKYRMEQTQASRGLDVKRIYDLDPLHDHD